MKRKRNWDVSFWKKSQCHFMQYWYVFALMHAICSVCVCVHVESLLLFSFYFHQSRPIPTRQPHYIFHKKKTYIQPLTHPVHLPGFAASCFALHPNKKNVRAEITVCEAALWETLPSASLPVFALLVPPYLFLIRYCFGWVAAGFILMFIKLSNSCPC